MHDQRRRRDQPRLLLRRQRRAGQPARGDRRDPDAHRPGLQRRGRRADVAQRALRDRCASCIASGIPASRVRRPCTANSAPATFAIRRPISARRSALLGYVPALRRGGRVARSAALVRGRAWTRAGLHARRAGVTRDVSAEQLATRCSRSWRVVALARTAERRCGGAVRRMVDATPNSSRKRVALRARRRRSEGSAHGRARSTAKRRATFDAEAQFSLAGCMRTAAAWRATTARRRRCSRSAAVAGSCAARTTALAYFASVPRRAAGLHASGHVLAAARTALRAPTDTRTTVPIRSRPCRPGSSRSPIVVDKLAPQLCDRAAARARGDRRRVQLRGTPAPTRTRAA